LPARIEIDRASCDLGGLRILDELSLDVAAGECVVLIGPSGAGKSTLLRAVNGLVPLAAGRIAIDGAEVPPEGRALDRLRARVGMVFQQFNLFAHLTARDNAALGPRVVQGRPRGEARARADAQLARVGLAAFGDRYPHQLSGGQQQRVAIARALAMEPAAMLFDEPTSALDVELRAEVLGAMRDLAADGMTMLVVTHELGFAREMASRIALLDGGKVLEVGPPGELLDHPRTPRAQEFLSQVHR